MGGRTDSDRSLKSSARSGTMPNSVHPALPRRSESWRRAPLGASWRDWTSLSARTEQECGMSVTAVASVAGGFAELGLDPRLVESLRALGYEEPTPIQREAIPPLLEGGVLVGRAATGTGKTAAFALPLLQRLANLGDDRAQPAALILVPTRELAMQVAEAVHRYGRALGIKVLPIYGGQSYGPPLRGLERGLDVVGAPRGRPPAHTRRRTLNLEGLATVVLDEADEMLDMGFAEDIESILGETPEGRQTLLFSATLPPRIAGIARRHLSDPVRIKIGGE